MKFDLYLFDLDDTLLDFQKSQNIAFEKSFSEFGILNAMSLYFSDYKRISQNLWDQFERNEIQKEVLRVRRFEVLFEQYGIQLDAHKFSDLYLHHLSDNNFHIEYSVDVLRAIKDANKKIGIITNGIKAVQYKRLEASNLKTFFDFIVVSEESGSAKPHVGIFEYAFQLAQMPKNNAIIIGDKIEADILGGLNAGISTCWFNPYNKQNSTPHIQPHYEIKSLLEILNFK